MFSILLGFFLLSGIYADSPCGDWYPYLDEKCIKVFPEMHHFDDAQKLCQAHEESTLISINSSPEQAFMTNYLFKESKLVDSVWIGVKLISQKFKYIDGSDLEFTNWAPGKPSNTTEKSCVQMSAEDPLGSWIDEPCQKMNRVVCQRMQPWTLAKLQQTVLADRKLLIESIARSENQNQNPVPIGFIYVQLPKEAPPTTIWPSFKWTDISPTYAGVFFRVSGGTAATFGQIQEENSPRVDDMQSNYYTAGSGGNSCNAEDYKVPANGWSSWVWTGMDGSGTAICTRLHASGGEVRPKNMAMKVWKRTG